MRRLPSNRMPKLPAARSRVIEWIMASLFIAPFVMLFGWATTWWLALGLVLWIWGGAWLEHRWLREIARHRGKGSICGFARSFDYRRMDTWIIRATWDSLQRCMPHCVHCFPLLPIDRLWDDLKLDGDDVDELAVEIAERCGRSWDHAERNPLYGRVFTVGDLVDFLMLQPLAMRTADGAAIRDCVL